MDESGKPFKTREVFFFSSRRRHTRLTCDWSSDVCSSDLAAVRADHVPATESFTALSFLGWVRMALGAPDAWYRDSQAQDACGRPVSDVGLVPGVGDADVEAAAVWVAENTSQYELAEVVFVGDDPVVNPKYSFVDRVGHPPSVLFVEAYPVGGAERDSSGSGQWFVGPVGQHAVA